MCLKKEWYWIKMLNIEGIGLKGGKYDKISDKITSFNSLKMILFQI